MKESVPLNATASATSQLQQEQQSLTVEQVTDVRNTLKGPPLTNKSVLIPFTGKAFLPGRLQPLLTPTPLPNNTTTKINANEGSDSSVVNNNNNITKQSTDDIAKKQEYVMVHNVVTAPRLMGNDTDTTETTTKQKEDNSGMIMTRQQALDYLQEEIDVLKAKESHRTIRIPSPTATDATHTTNNNNKSVTSTATSSSSRTLHNNLPSMEIREEVDDAGHIVTGEAVNVSNYLQYLSQQQQPQQPKHSQIRTNDNNIDDCDDDTTSMNIAANHTNGGSNGTTTKVEPMPHHPPERPVVAATLTTAEILERHSVTTDEMDTGGSVVENNRQLPKSDAEYDAISRRLEELMFLEEQQEQRSSSGGGGSGNNNNSSNNSLVVQRRPQTNNTGWKKGFLNTPKKKKLTTPPVLVQQQQTTKYDATGTAKKKVAVGQSKSSSPVSTNDADRASPYEQCIPVNDKINSTKMVSFTDTDDIQMIPRIGQRSIKDPLPSSQPPPQQQQQQQRMNSAVSSHVVEKKTLNHARGRRATTTTSIDVPSQKSRTSIVDDTVVSPQRKLSKFAQERQQLRKK